MSHISTGDTVTTHSSEAKHDPGISQETKLGLGVSLSIGLPLLATVAALLYVFRRKRSRKAPVDHQPPRKTDRPSVIYEAPGTFIGSELYGSPVVYEMRVHTTI